VDGFPVASAREIQAARERLARIGASVPRITITLRPACIVAVAVVGTITSVLPLIVALTSLVMLLYGARATPERQPEVVIVAVAFVSIAVAWIALITEIAGIEVHRRLRQAEAGRSRERRRTQADVRVRCYFGRAPGQCVVARIPSGHVGASVERRDGRTRSRTRPKTRSRQPTKSCCLAYSALGQTTASTTAAD
jgi:hypothetical protein